MSNKKRGQEWCDRCKAWKKPVYNHGPYARCPVCNDYTRETHGDAQDNGLPCGHSVCRQNWMDTGETVCIEDFGPGAAA